MQIDPETGKPKFNWHNTFVALNLYSLGLLSLAIKAVVITWTVKQVWF